MGTDTARGVILSLGLFLSAGAAFVLDTGTGVSAFVTVVGWLIWMLAVAVVWSIRSD
jgi:hypothetical protein